MKKFSVLMIAVLMAASTVWADDDIKELDPQKLPPITLSIIKSYFPGTEVVTATKLKSKIKNAFNVTLNDGTLLEFDKDGQWQRVDCGGAPVPVRMINLKIQAWLNENRRDAQVVLMEKDKKGNYTIQLDDETVLHFDNQFRFLN